MHVITFYAKEQKRHYYLKGLSVNCTLTILDFVTGSIMSSLAAVGIFFVLIVLCNKYTIRFNPVTIPFPTCE